MAESTAVDISRIVCPFYIYSSCRYGDRCRYYLAEKGRNMGNVACEFSLNSTCKYHDESWFNHAVIAEEGSSISESTDIGSYNMENVGSDDNVISIGPEILEVELCSHFRGGMCPYPECPLIHGELCKQCDKYCLNPFVEPQRKLHGKVCGPDSDKICRICLKIVVEKERPCERRFGILENCNHVFCFSCIKKWRKIKRQENCFTRPINTRTCPVCRVYSNFVISSEQWVVSEEKVKLIANYKDSLSRIPCKFFKAGIGECRLNVSCFYLHATPDVTRMNFVMNSS